MRAFILVLLPSIAVAQETRLDDAAAKSIYAQATWASGEFRERQLITIDSRTVVYYAARKKNGPMCIGVADASSPGTPYKDHGPITCAQKGVSFGAVDPFVIADGGTRWLVWKEDGSTMKKATPLLFQQLRKDGLQLLDDARQLFQNDTKWEGDAVSQPALLRRDTWLYAFYVAGDSKAGCNAIGVARAPQIQGPWTKAPTNPLALKSCVDRPMITSQNGKARLGYSSQGAPHVVDLVFAKDGWPSLR